MNLQTMYHKKTMKKEKQLLHDLILSQSMHSWNACQIIFGSYHQSDIRFSEQSRGFQCTGNALSILSLSRYKQ